MNVPACKQAATPNHNDTKQLMHNDFEQNLGWGSITEGSLTEARAHSGRWAVRASPEVNFSFTFERVLSRMAPQLIHKMRLQGWALRANPGSTAKLVVQVNASPTDTTKVFYGALSGSLPTLAGRVYDAGPGSAP